MRISEIRTDSQRTKRKIFLYHLTDAELVDNILREGFDPGTYFGTLPIIRYYASQKLHKTDSPVIFRVQQDRFNQADLVPDIKGIQDPPSASVTELTDDDLEEEWDRSQQDWKASLTLIGSVQYMANLRVTSKDIFERSASPKASPTNVPDVETLRKTYTINTARQALCRLAGKVHKDKTPQQVNDIVASLDDTNLYDMLGRYLAKVG